MFKAKQKHKTRPSFRVPKYDLLVGTNEHNAVSIARGGFEHIDRKRKRFKRADRRGRLYVAMVRTKAGPGVDVAAVA